jgi:hypothetical protein
MFIPISLVYKKTHMKRITLSILIIMLVSVLVNAQDQNKRKNQNQSTSSQTQSTETEGEDETGQLLGDENRKANKKNSEDQTSDANYRNNKVSGNPNNRSIGNTAEQESTTPSGAGQGTDSQNNNAGQGTSGDNATSNDNEDANMQTAEDGNNEGSSGSTTTTTTSDPNASNTPAVRQRTTSESGSPAVLAEDGRDGTNNMQRATTTKSSGRKTNANPVDEDEANKKSTLQRQSPDTREMKQAENDPNRKQTSKELQDREVQPTPSTELQRDMASKKKEGKKDKQSDRKKRKRNN